MLVLKNPFLTESIYVGGGRYWGLNSGLHARQLLFHLSQVSSPFSLVILETGSCLFPGQPGQRFFCFKSPVIDGLTGATTTTSFFLLRWVFIYFLLFYYSYVHTRLGSFLPPAHTPSLTTHSTSSLSPPPPQYPAETILPLSLILL
jgi:hypothetical protein